MHVREIGRQFKGELLSPSLRRELPFLLSSHKVLGNELVTEKIAAERTLDKVFVPLRSFQLISSSPLEDKLLRS